MTACGRNPYPSEAAAELAASLEAGTRRPVYRCSWCRSWHVGTDPGRIVPCPKCETLIARMDGRPHYVDAHSGRMHTNPVCRRLTRAQGRVWHAA